MKKGLHPQMQWISYVTQSGRLMHVMMTKIHHVGKVYHFRARRQLAQSVGQIAKFKRRYEKEMAEKVENAEKWGSTQLKDQLLTWIIMDSFWEHDLVSVRDLKYPSISKESVPFHHLLFYRTPSYFW